MQLLRGLYGLFLFEVQEVVVDDCLYECSTMYVVPVAVVNSNEVHEDDASGSCRVGVEVFEKGFVGVGGIVTIAVAQ